MMMKNYYELIKLNCNRNWPYMSDHPYIISIIGGSGSGKTNVLLNLINHQRPDIDKIHLHIKDPFRREKVEMKTLKNQKVFIDYSQTIDDVYEHLEDENPTAKKKTNFNGV